MSPEDWDGDIWGDPDQELNHESSEKSELDESEFTVAPIIKTEVSVGPRVSNQKNITGTILWDPLPLANLQEKYWWKPGESEIEYLWHVSIPRGDCTVLNQDEVYSFWGPGVFLTGGPDLHNEPHSTTCQRAYWEGGIDPQEWGEPLLSLYNH